jgi:hypothetical protein
MTSTDTKVALIHVRLPLQLRDELREVAWRDRVSMNQVVLELVESYISEEKAKGNLKGGSGAPTKEGS